MEGSRLEIPPQVSTYILRSGDPAILRAVDADGTNEATLSDAGEVISGYRSPETNEMLMRIWTFGFGAGNYGDGGNPENPYVIRYDEVKLTTGAGFGVTPNGG